MFRPAPSSGALRQGEILTDVRETVLQRETSDEGDPLVAFKEHPYAIVLTQDCDLDLDYRVRCPAHPGSIKPEDEKRLIQNVLLGEMVTAQELKGQPGMNSKVWNRIQKNQDIRYQFISSADADNDLKGDGLPELGMDFKRYFCVPAEILYFQIQQAQCDRRTCLRAPYVQHLSQRFSSYLARVALPQDYESKPDR